MNSKHWSAENLVTMDRVNRLNLINSLSGIKPANLIGTISKEGTPNLAIISSVVHLSSDPPSLGFIMRPHQHYRRDTYQNILDTKCFTINHIARPFVDNAHYTSAKFDAHVSEFDVCALTKYYHDSFDAPFVQESPIKIGLRCVEKIHIKTSDTTMVIGQIEHILVDERLLTPEYYIDLEKAQTVGASGLNSYYRLKKLKDLPYARVTEVPPFKNSSAPKNKQS